MNTFLWVCQFLLAFAFIGAGSVKVIKSREDLLAMPKMEFVEMFPFWFIRCLGTSQILGGIGLILPPLLGIMVFLVPVAAACLFLIMVAAFITNVIQGKYDVANIVLMVLCVVVAYGRWDYLPL